VTRAFSFVVAGVVTLISIIVHRVSVLLFAPGSSLYGIASSATHFNAGSKAWLWFQIIAIWAPLLAIGGIWLWVLVREFRRQVTTATARAGRRP
jgi:hypothetical protein